MDPYIILRGEKRALDPSPHTPTVEDIFVAQGRFNEPIVISITYCDVWGDTQKFPCLPFTLLGDKSHRMCWGM